MKEEILKFKYQKFSSVSHKPYSLISDKMSETPTRHPLFLQDTFHEEEKIFEENFANPLFSVYKEYFMVVLEKNEHKVSLKLFFGYIKREVGKFWFKRSKNCQFFVVNTKTGNFYDGALLNYQNKIKKTRKIRQNFFLGDPLSNFQGRIKNSFSNFSQSENDNRHHSILEKFMDLIDGRKNTGSLCFDDRLFKFYLDRKGIKYPDNFYVYSKFFNDGKFRKNLKRNNFKVVETFMETNGLRGKKLKKTLHICQNINLPLYLLVTTLFDENWIHQDEGFLKMILSSKYGFNLSEEILLEFKKIVSKNELHRCFKIFKKIIENHDFWTFADHIIFYVDLKKFGERNIKWNSDGSKENDFMEEHLDWTEKIDYYRRGIYRRIYPKIYSEVINAPILDGSSEFFPTILNSSTEYNNESIIQSNCVKTYIGRASSIIVSIRKESLDSENRATVEYRINLVDDTNKIKFERIQTLGRFNSKLEESWNNVLKILDTRLNSIIENNFYQNVKLIKECANGVKLESDSEFDTNGYLRWTYKSITQYEW